MYWTEVGLAAAFVLLALMAVTIYALVRDKHRLLNAAVFTRDVDEAVLAEVVKGVVAAGIEAFPLPVSKTLEFRALVRVLTVRAIAGYREALGKALTGEKQ